MRYAILTLLTILLITGCKKYTNGPAENFTEEYVFDPLDKNGLLAQQVLANIYADLPTGFNRIGGDLLDAATDDALPSRNGTTLQTVILGNINNTNHPDGAWARYYVGIRKVNLFLSKVDVVPKPDEVKIWKGEARFLRALFYFELLKRYGGIPLVGDKVYNSSENIQIPRNTFEECVNYIVSECDAIKTVVRAEPFANAADYGKVPRGAVLALKSRLLLYAASPLYNGGVPDNASAQQKALMGYPTASNERWDLAAQAANELLLLNTFPLETTYNNVFLNRKNNEVILSYLRGTTTDIENTNGPIGYSQGALGNGFTSPTQDLVDAFLMTNGKRINEAGSGYDPANPYTGRDARLGNTVLRNGSQWLGRAVQTFEDGLDKPNNGTIQTKTSYYLRKFMGNFGTAASYSAQNHNFVLFRSAEIMLNYAEALNEYTGPDNAVNTQLINIRKRAGIAAGTNGKYGLPVSPAPTKEEMRDLIRNERRIEMAFEEQRYWDVRRWKIAEDVFNRDLTGLKITDDGAGNLTYQSVVAGKIVFRPAMYYYAIPYAELIKNTNLIQNYGW